MKIYQHLFAYLNGESSEVENTVLHGCDRPIVTINSNVRHSSLIKHSENIYELGFPYLKPTDLEQHDDRCQTELKIIVDDIEKSLLITDEVIDEAAIEDEAQLKEWLEKYQQQRLSNFLNLVIQSCQDLFNSKSRLQAWLDLNLESNLIKTIDLFVRDYQELFDDKKQLKKWFDSNRENSLNTSVSLLIQNFNELLNDKNLWRSRQDNIAKINLHCLPEHLAKFNFSKASLPLIVSLESQYELSRKLRIIIPNLRHQLRRKAELMSLGRIQEMDSYCLRDYIRRPGHTPEQKAGARQQLMGVRQEQNYDTLENRFLVYFAGKLLHLECFRYEKSKAKEHEQLVKKLRQTIDVFTQSSLVKNISYRHFKLTKPNYVLQNNPIYNSFYQAYQKYVYKRSQKENLWSYRHNLLGDTVYLCLTAALLRFQGVNLKPLANLEIRTNPDYGSYLLSGKQPVSVPVFVKNFLYEFKLDKNSALSKGNCCLTIEIHDLNSLDLAVKVSSFPIWIFWYKPSEKIINSANDYINKHLPAYPLGVLFYLEASPNRAELLAEAERQIESKATSESSNILLSKIPNPLDLQNFTTVADFLAREIIKPLAEMVR